jgi:hypothetical protein
MRITAQQLAANANLWPPESSPDGRTFCWSGSDPEIQFSFSLDRRSALQLQIRLHALMQDEYARQASITVDGQNLAHRVIREGTLTILSLELPARKRNNNALTVLKLVLPGTCSPADQGMNQDDRQLGVAINEIRLVRSLGAVAWLLRRLRSKPLSRVQNQSLVTAPNFNEATAPNDGSIRAMNAHLEPVDLLVEIETEIARQKNHLRKNSA